MSFLVALGVQPNAKIKLAEVKNPTVAPRGSKYLVKLDVSPIDADKAFKALTTLENEVAKQFNAKVIYSIASEREIYLMIKGSPFLWSAFLAWLPTILSLLGITLAGVSIWQVISIVPSWVWATLIISGFLIFISPIVGDILRRR